MRYAMIMAGGAGTRLWPMSRKNKPKQLLPFITRPGDDKPRSLLELAAARLEGLVEPDRRYICTSEAYREPIRQSLPQFTNDRILGEPVGRDTINAVGFAAAVFAKQDPDAVFAVLTADHIIEPDDIFQQRIEVGFRLVEADPSRLVTFSITPTYAATGYGYVERGRPIHGIEGCMVNDQPIAFEVARFVEKPDKHRAEVYVNSGMFGWNSGMFVYNAQTFLNCLKRFKPENYEGLMKIQEAWGTDAQQQVLEEIYPTLPKTSVDYGIMEPASTDRQVSIAAVMMDVNWLDVGSWPSYAQTLEPDEAGNRLTGQGKSLIVDGKNNLIVNTDPDHTITILSAENLIVIRTKDATLVMPADKAEQLKELYENVDESLK